MQNFFKKPLIQVKLENPHLRSGRYVTRLNLGVSGCALVKISFPAIVDWKPIYLLTKGFEEFPLVVPINTILTAQYLYFFGYTKQDFQIKKSEWDVNIPSAQVSKNVGSEILNVRQPILSSNLKSLVFKKSFFSLMQKNTIIKVRRTTKLKGGRFSINASIKKFNVAIYLKRVFINPKMFYRNEALKDE